MQKMFVLFSFLIVMTCDAVIERPKKENRRAVLKWSCRAGRDGRVAKICTTKFINKKLNNNHQENSPVRGA